MRSVVLAICCASMFVVVMDISIVNVALPAVRADLRASESDLQWTVDSYNLVLACFLVLAGSVADRVGRRRVFQAGLIVFGLGSVLCAVAPTVGWLVAARGVQAVGGTMLNPVALAIVASAFPERSARARAVGIFASMFGVSLGLGPVLGGTLVDRWGWHLVFWVNVPVVACTLIASAVFVPESRAARARRFDPGGQVLVVVLLGCVVLASIDSGRLGWTSPTVITCFSIAACALLALVRHELRRRDPLLELGLFRSPPFSAAVVVAVAGQCGFGVFLFVSTQYLQEVRSLSASDAGLCSLPVGAAVLLLSPLTGRLVAARGARLPVVVGGAALLVAGVTSCGLGVGTPLAVVIASYVLVGVSQAGLTPATSVVAIAEVPPSTTGLASSLVSTGRQVGITLGVAVAGSLVSTATRGTGAGPALAQRPAWCVVVVAGLVVVVVGARALGAAASNPTGAPTGRPGLP